MVDLKFMIDIDPEYFIRSRKKMPLVFLESITEIKCMVNSEKIHADPAWKYM